jgi:hypothetical protein
MELTRIDERRFRRFCRLSRAVERAEKAGVLTEERWRKALATGTDILAKCEDGGLMIMVHALLDTRPREWIARAFPNE